MPPRSPITEFALLARAHDEVLDLEALTVGVARMGRPELDAMAVKRSLDGLAETVGEHADRSLPPDRLAARLSLAIGTELDFRGDPGAPVGPDASYIDQALQTRRGLPITLAAVWMLIGARLGIPIGGISYPGHFLVCLDAPGARIFLDPYHGGNPRDGASLLARLGGQPADRKILEPCGVRPMVTRMLANLKNLWVDRGEYASALGAVDRMLLVGGEIPGELRDRGLICLHLDRPGEAARDFQRYLTLRPQAEDRPVIEALLEKIQGAT